MGDEVAMSVMPQSLPFEQQPGESAQAFAAFVVYRDMQADRSLDAVRRKVGKSKALMERWSTRHNWVERARSYDAAIDARARAATEQETVERRRRMIESHAEQARELGTIARRLTDEFNRRFDEKGTLQWISGDDFIKMVAQLPKILDTAQKLERLAEGEATERHEHIFTAEQILKMSEEEFASLVREQGME